MAPGVQRAIGSPGLADGKGQEISSLLGARWPQPSLAPTVFQFLKMDGALWASTPLCHMFLVVPLFFS